MDWGNGTKRCQRSPVRERAGRTLRLLTAAVASLGVAAAVAPGAGAQPGTTVPAGRDPVPVVRLPFPQDDGTLTPYTFELGYPLVTLVYDTLLWRDATGVPRPWLARAVETGAGGRELTVRLAEGARWHDGTPVTAEDVAFTFGFVADRPHPRFTPELRAVERVVAVDPATAVITLRRPSPGFLDQPLSDLPILPAHLWRGLPRSLLAPEGLPVGSGPYRLVEHRPGEAYRFEANPGYFRGAPRVTTLEVPIIGDADGTLRALESRRVDMIPVSLPAGAAARVEGLGTNVEEGPAYLGTVLMFNVRQAPFDRLEVRQALARALDLPRIARAVGAAVPASKGYLHPESPWASTATLKETDTGAQARQLLTALHLPPIEVLAADNDPVKREAARQVALALQRAGTRASSRTVPRDELSRLVGEDGSAPSFGAAIWTSPPLASYDPDFLRRLFGSAPEEATFNYSGYRSQTFDEAAELISVTTDLADRRDAVGLALQVLAEDVPVVPLFFSTGTYTYRPAVYDGWVFVKGAGILDKRSFVDPVPERSGEEAAGDGADGDGAGGEGAGGGSVGSGPSPLGYAALALVGAAVLLALGGVVAGRRGGRRDRS